MKKALRFLAQLAWYVVTIGIVALICLRGLIDETSNECDNTDGDNVPC